MITKRFTPLAAGVLCALAFIFSCSSDEKAGLLEYGGQTYNTIVIDGKEMMVENLNYNVPGSRCYGNNPANCAKYGRLYNWQMAMALPLSCISTPCAEQINASHRGICPEGWHIPTNAEWDKLYSYADGSNETRSPYDSPTAGKYLKAKTGWIHCGPPSSYSSSSQSGSSSSSNSSSSSGLPYSSNTDGPYLCEDALGFAALPGGYGRPGENDFGEEGEVGFWWSASEYDASTAYGRFIYNRYESASYDYKIKTYFYSVRCFKD